MGVELAKTEGVALVNTATGELVQYDESAGPLDLEMELVNHLAFPESSKVLYSERFNEDYLGTDMDDETVGAAVLKHVFAHIRKYHKPPTPEEVKTHFKKIEFEPIRSDVRWLLERFRMRWVKNLAADVVEELADGIGKADPRPAVDQGVKDLQKIRERVRPQNTLLTNDDYQWVIDAHFDRIEEMDGAHGVPFGFPLIDKTLLGLKKGQLVFTIGRPKRFKSWMLLKSMVEAQKAGYRCVFFTLEMPLEEMYQRYACMVCAISYPEFMRGDLTQKEYNHMMSTMEAVKKGETSILLVQPPVGERGVADMAHMAREFEADVVYIDQIKFIECDIKVAADKRFAIIERVCEELKEAAREFPIYVACQFNREAANLTEMADLSKIGLSDAIGQTGDILLGLYQSKEMRQSNELQFGVIDARAFEPAIWTIQVELSTHSNFRCTGLAE